ncbi:ARM repeat-containing protein, partial [Martensiomyces pterosporus]
MDPAVFDRQIRSLLNKLTLDNFDTVSDELLKWGDRSADETDGRILRHLIMLVFQKATDEPTWASMYARLCHKLMSQTSSKVEDHNLRTKEGSYLAGGYLVRKYLLTKCQEDFERGWKVEMPEDLESEEYYDAMKIKRRGLGLVKFIGELFLLDMLTERIMHECVKRLLSNVDTPEEEETESLAKLITTVGKKLDRPQAKSYMDAYFARIQTMSTNKHLTSRIRFMLKDVIDLRQANWASRVKSAGPKTIAEIHEEAERKK